MKNLVSFRAIALMAFLLSCTGVSAQISLGDIFNKVKEKVSSDTTSVTTSAQNGKGALGAILGNVLSDVLPETETDIIGTWKYDGPAVVFSSGNVLKNAGGSLASAAIEKKIQEQLDKYGMKKDQFSMTFNSDSTFVQTLSGKQLSGTFSVENGNIVLKYGGKMSQLAGTTQVSKGSLLILMDMSKLLTFAGKISEMTTNSTIKAAASFIGSMDGMQGGLRFKKE